MSDNTFILITGRTIKQGMASVSGKKSDNYKKETSYVEVSKNILEQMNIEEGETVILESQSSSIEVTCKGADLEDDIVFMPYGPTANTLIGTDTGGTGMPNSKSNVVKLKRKEAQSN
ncbi:MAG: molybdopterin dinucleotide-binding protein [Halanaerobium sp. MDAL1]|nr:MAG: molybdopterin dinucleotide-binding protein [Halanaerobium sp. MDAL1]